MSSIDFVLKQQRRGCRHRRYPAPEERIRCPQNADRRFPGPPFNAGAWM